MIVQMITLSCRPRVKFFCVLFDNIEQCRSLGRVGQTELEHPVIVSRIQHSEVMHACENADISYAAHQEMPLSLQHHERPCGNAQYPTAAC